MPVCLPAEKLSVSDGLSEWVTDNFKARDASASKNVIVLQGIHVNYSFDVLCMDVLENFLNIIY